MGLTKKRIEELKKLYVNSKAGVSNAEPPFDQMKAYTELLRIFTTPFGAGGRCEFEELLALAEKQLEAQVTKAAPAMQFSCVRCSSAVSFVPGGARCIRCGIVEEVRAEAPKK